MEEKDEGRIKKDERCSNGAGLSKRKRGSLTTDY
jgi:hypothetical protein